MMFYQRCSRPKEKSFSLLHSSLSTTTASLSHDQSDSIEMSRDKPNADLQPIRERLSSKVEPLSDSREFLSSSTDSLDGPPTHAFKLQRGKGFKLPLLALDRHLWSQFLVKNPFLSMLVTLNFQIFLHPPLKGYLFSFNFFLNSW